MTSDSHDTIVFRLAQILVKLNQGEKLDPRALADEFGVNLRTIQRDLNERFCYLPLEKVDGRYHLHPSFLGKLTTKDMQRFASLAGVRGLFPALSDDFFREIFDDRIQNALLVKGHHYEDLAGKESAFREIESAIVDHRRLAFAYDKDDGAKQYEDVCPYKLINNKGIWYLAAVDGSKLKTFSFTKITCLRVLEARFTPNNAVEQSIVSEDGAWIGQTRTEVVLKISKDVAGYFKRRKLVANQQIEKELEDGGLILSAKIGHKNQIIPIVRYWIPHIRIISPDSLQAELEAELAKYLT